MNKYSILLLALLISGIGISRAQEKLTRLRNNPQLSNSTAPFRQKSGTRSPQPLTLPFTDDFSRQGAYPDTALWSDNNAFTNQTFGVHPPTIGIATLDATDALGRIYPHAKKTPFPADTLTSHPIRTDSLFSPIARPLTAADSLYFSFFYQPGGGMRNHPWEGLGDAPEGTDSLILEFGFQPGDSVLAPDSVTLLPRIEWVPIWSAGGMSLENFVRTYHLDTTVMFRQVMIPLTDSRFFNRMFRFRFRNLASLEYSDENPTWAGNVDFWNIDYVRLDRGRGINDTFIDDIAITANPGSLLKKYEAMPWSQFQPSELKSSFTLQLANLSNSTKNAMYRYTVTNPEGQVVGQYDGGSYNIGYFRRSGFQTYAPHARPTLGSIQLASNADTVDFRITHIHQEAGSGDRNLHNDTAVFIQAFRNYYAYDDGTPEAGYTVVDIDTYHTAMALRFHLNRPDTLRAVSMYINSVLEDANRFDFNLTVWKEKDNLPDELIYSQPVSQEVPEQLYAFQLFYLEQPVAVSGSFYVGYQLTGRDFLNIGFDQNSDHSEEVRYFSGNKWHTSFLYGTPMIRPFIGDGWDPQTVGTPKAYTEESIGLYPNPAHSTLHIQLPASVTAENATMEVISLSGQLLYRSAFMETLPTEQLPAGMYLLRITGKKRTLQGKFIVQ
jgi:hypothetical protein